MLDLAEAQQDADFAEQALTQSRASSFDTRVILPEGATRADAVYLLTQNFPMNEYGLPTHVLRSDLLPYPLGTCSQYDVDAATMGLVYFEGFPQFENGKAFWEQMVHETYQQFMAFQAFVDQAEEHGIRQMPLLSASTGHDLTLLMQWAKEFYWSVRARAYDIFIVAAELKKREHRIRKMESKHYAATNDMIETLLTKFDDADWIAELNAKEAVEALETLIKVQRQSLGLTGQNSSSVPKDVLPAGASTEAVMRQITRGAGLTQASSDTFQKRLDSLLSDEADGMVVQEAILRISRQERGPAHDIEF